MLQQELFSLLHGYAALVPLKNLEWPSRVSSDEIQDFLIGRCIASDHFRSYPPSANYQKSFWKWTIACVEDSGEEVRGELLARYLALLNGSRNEAISPIQAPSPSYITYLWKDSSYKCDETGSNEGVEAYRKCTLFESRTIIESGTTGLRTWAASFVLAEYISLHRHEFESSRVLELGSGTGFIGILLTQLQLEGSNRESDACDKHEIRPSLCLTDLNEQVLMRCKSNVELPCNGVLPHPDLQFLALDWFDALDEHRRSTVISFLKKLQADIILGADLVYDVSIIPALVAMIHLALTLDPTDSAKQAIIAATVRNENTLQTFTNTVQETGLRVEEIEVDHTASSFRIAHSQPDVTGEGRNHVKLFVITNKATSC